MNFNLSEEKLTEILAIARCASIQCSICKNNVKNPFFLSCKHYFCGSCLKSYLDPAGQTTRKCPNCLTPIRPRSYYECPELENPFTDLIDMIEKKSLISLPLEHRMPLKLINYPKNRYKCSNIKVREKKKPKEIISNEIPANKVKDSDNLLENSKENVPLNRNIQLPKRNRSRSRTKAKISESNLNSSKRITGKSKLQIEIISPKKDDVVKNRKGRPKKSVVDLKDNIKIGESQNSANAFEPSVCTESRSRRSLRVKKQVKKKSPTNVNTGKIKSITHSKSSDDLFQNNSDQSNLSDLYSLASFRFPEFKPPTSSSTKMKKAPTLASLDIEEDAIQKVNQWMSRDDCDFKNITSITIRDHNGQRKRVKKSKSFQEGSKPSKRTRISRIAKKKRRSYGSDDSRFGGVSGLVQLDVQIEQNTRRSKTPKKDDEKMIDVELKSKNVVVPVKSNIDLELFSATPTVMLDKVEPEQFIPAKDQHISNSCPNMNNEKLTNPLFNISDTIIPMVELMERAAQTLSKAKYTKSKQQILQEMLDFSKEIRDKLDLEKAREIQAPACVKCPNCSHIFPISNTVAVDLSGVENSMVQEVFASAKNQRKRNQPSTLQHKDSKKICLEENVEEYDAEGQDVRTPSRHSSASSDVVESTPGERKTALHHSSVFSSRKSLEYGFKGFNVTEIDLPSSIILGTESADYAESRLIAVLPPPPEFGDPVEENEPEDQTSILPNVTELQNYKTLTPPVKIDQLKDASIIDATPMSPKNVNDIHKTSSAVESPARSHQETEKDIFKTPERTNDNQPSKIVKNMALNSPTTSKQKNFSSANFSPKIKNVASSLSPSTLPNTQQFFNQLKVASTPKTRSQTKLINRQNICVATSRLSLEDSLKVKQFCGKFGTEFTTEFMGMTHLVAHTRKNNAIANHTVKYLYAVSHHLWVVNINWIMESLKNDKLLPESNYECLDHSSLPGPRSSRLLGNNSLIFQNFAFYLGTLNQCIPPDILTKCLTKCGGKVSATFDELIEQPESLVKMVISEIENTDSLIKCASSYQEWYEKYKIVTVDVIWICKAVGRNQLIALESIAGCEYSERIEGYPSELFATLESEASDDSSSQEDD